MTQNVRQLEPVIEIRNSFALATGRPLSLKSFFMTDFFCAGSYFPAEYRQFITFLQEKEKKLI